MMNMNEEHKIEFSRNSTSFKSFGKRMSKSMLMEDKDESLDSFSSLVSQRSSKSFGLSFARNNSEPVVDAHANDNVFSWTNIHVHVPHRTDKKKSVELLHGVSGSAKSSTMVALVGPSGAGKSVFLDVLSFRKTVGTITGDRRFNKNALSKETIQSISSYCTQEDVFHPTQTVLEAVMFQAMMRLAPSIPYNKKLYMAKERIAMAGLKGKDNDYVGGALPGGVLVRGLSGGQKRRLSICCTTINKPDILFADEPTSGLDSLAALMIMKLLRNFANTGMIILCTIHQPRQAIWSMFDKVLVLAKGYQLFYGTPSGCEEWFIKGLSVKCPSNTSLSDFIMDAANIDFDKTEVYGDKTLNTMQDLARFADEFRDENPAVFLESENALEVQTVHPPTDKSTTPDVVFLTQVSDVTSGLQLLFAPKTADKPFTPSWWMYLFWPFSAFFFLLWSLCVKPLGLKPYVLLDSWDFYKSEGAEPLHTQIWSTYFSAYQYLPNSCYVQRIKEQINDIVGYADMLKIKLLGLDALNKAEWATTQKGSIKEPFTTQVADGETMIAATTCANVLQIVTAKKLPKRVYLTGSTSKIGRAVAVYLVTKDYEVMCDSMSPAAFQELQSKLPRDLKEKLTVSQNLADGSKINVWIVGEEDQVEVNEYMPEMAEAVVFCVRDPVNQSKRPDLNVTNGGLFELDASSYSHRSNALGLSKEYLPASYAGCLVQAAMGWNEKNQEADIDIKKVEDYLYAAYSLHLRLPPVDHLVTHDVLPGWFDKYKVLLARNLRNYVRNYGNVLARVGVAICVAICMGLIYWNMGEHGTREDMAGAIFFGLFVLCLLPYASQSSFLYDRSFFQGENAAGMYPVSAYYVANVTLELILNAFIGLVFSVIAYNMINFQAFVHPENKTRVALGYIGIMILTNCTSNAQVLCTCLLSPNQEIAFVLAAAYTAIAFLTTGMLVQIPLIWVHMRWLTRFSMVRYFYQAILQLFYLNNSHWEPFAGQLLHKIKLDQPSTVEGSVGVGVGFYLIFIFIGFLGLKYLYKERR